MKLLIVSPTLPPRLDGIGDYTARLAAELADRVETTVVTDSGAVADPIRGVTVLPAFSTNRRRSVRALLALAREEQPDWLLLQYNPFSYGRWGLNLHLPLVLGSIRRRMPRTRIAVMFHELFTPLTSLRFAVMSSWQRAQLRALGRSADRIFCSTENWTKRLASWFPGTELIHLPVGSNIPHIELGKEEARARLGLEPDGLVLGLFGTAHPSRMLGLTRNAVEAVLRQGHDAVVLYVGPDSPALEREFAGIPLLTTAGAAAADEVSRRLAAMDVHLVAFIDGVSTRRGTLMAGLQHGVPTVGTLGHSTDGILLDAAEEALLLAPVDAPADFSQSLIGLVGDVDLRQRVGVSGRRLYEREFDWPVTSKRLLEALAE